MNVLSNDLFSFDKHFNSLASGFKSKGPTLSYFCAWKVKVVCFLTSG